jgi:hypothetical protein
MSSWLASNHILYTCIHPHNCAYTCWQVIHERNYDMPIELFDQRQRRFLNHSTVVWSFTDFAPSGSVAHLFPFL